MASHYIIVADTLNERGDVMIQFACCGISSGVTHLNDYLKELDKKGAKVVNTHVVTGEYGTFAYIVWENGSSIDKAKIKELVLKLEKEEIECQTFKDAFNDDGTDDTISDLVELVVQEFKKTFTEEDKQMLNDYREECLGKIVAPFHF